MNTQNSFFYLTFDIAQRAANLSKVTDGLIKCIQFPDRQEIEINLKGTKLKAQLNECTEGEKIGADILLRDDHSHPFSGHFSTKKGAPARCIVGIICDEWCKPLYTLDIKTTGKSGAWMVDIKKFIY